MYKGKTKDAIPSFLRGCTTEAKRVKDIFKLKGLMSAITGVPHQVDHMWPLADGGPHWSGNMQILTATENRKKWATVDLEVKYNIQKSLEEERLAYEHT
jgi:5-methylcytosine-specific restriction endonuclease McrA